MLRDRAILDLPEDTIGAPDDPVQGRFVLAGDLTVTTSIRTGFVVGGRGSAINNVIREATGGDGSKGKGYYLDLGQGASIFEFEFRGWRGAEVPDSYDSDGKPTSYKPVQWGNTGDADNLTYADATGADPTTQVNLLHQYLRNIEIDSRQTAQLQYGEFSEEGMYEPVDVVLESPELRRVSDTPVAYDGTLTLVEAKALDEIESASNRGPA